MEAISLKLLLLRLTWTAAYALVQCTIFPRTTLDKKP